MWFNLTLPFHPHPLPDHLINNQPLITTLPQHIDCVHTHKAPITLNNNALNEFYEITISNEDFGFFGIHVCKFYRQQAGQQQSSNQVYDGFKTF